MCDSEVAVCSGGSKFRFGGSLADIVRFTNLLTYLLTYLLSGVGTKSISRGEAKPKGPKPEARRAEPR